jgi:hypothetical protein
LFTVLLTRRIFFYLTAVDLPQVFGWREIDPVGVTLERSQTFSLKLPDYFTENDTSREFSLLFTINSELVNGFNLSVKSESDNSSETLFSLLLSKGQIKFQKGENILGIHKPDYVFEEWQKFVIIYRGRELLLHDCRTVQRMPFPERSSDLPSWDRIAVTVKPNLPTREDVRVSTYNVS